ncbi:hypothetical protein SAMN06297387_12853 [Streptomyces zhaozhouensis]|uniref:Uncharacterized protein n=1 Tax=Streptomyces zhaozhouensis TaxID=1300267 RepID=A0A286E891_9ACTN|nr:hypothetical protein [Streptomyces zhaozhouensis]SOD67074.1 hypothetical protein SAMN06297387_12853 [Streptomyces zhaozhouensis]
MMPTIERVRGAIRATRDAAGRVATLTGTAALVATAATGPSPAAVLVALPTTAAATAGGYAVTVLSQRETPHWLARGLYLVPGVTLAIQLLAAQLVGGWWQWGAAAVWTGAVWAVRPARWARDLISPPTAIAAEGESRIEEVYGIVQAPQPTAPEINLTGPLEARVASFWAGYVAADGGPAPGTRLEQLEVSGPRQWAAHIVAPAGQPVGTVSIPHLSALMDTPEDLITIGPVPGSGSGRRQIRVGTTGPDTFAALWEQQIAPVAMPGTTITRVRLGTADGAEIPTPRHILAPPKEQP